MEIFNNKNLVGLVTVFGLLLVFWMTRDSALFNSGIVFASPGCDSSDDMSFNPIQLEVGEDMTIRVTSAIAHSWVVISVNDANQGGPDRLGGGPGNRWWEWDYTPAAEGVYVVKFYIDAEGGDISKGTKCLEDSFTVLSCPDCVVESECRDHIEKACSVDDAKTQNIFQLAIDNDDYWCTVNEHDGCEYVKSGVKLVNGQRGPDYWEPDRCNEGEGSSNLYGERKVFVDDISKYTVKARVEIDDNSWVWINGQEVLGLHRECCGWTGWMDVTNYFKSGLNQWNIIEFRAEDTCSGDRYFDLDWHIALVSPLEEGFFEDNFDFASFRNIYSGDECKLGERLGGDGVGNWNVFLQNTSCIDQGDWCRQTVPTCPQDPPPDPNNPDPNTELGQDWPYLELIGVPYWYNANVGVVEEEGIKKLKMYRGEGTIDDACASPCDSPNKPDYAGKLGHRFMVVESAEKLVSSETFKLDINVQLDELQGWGVGWYVGDIIKTWYVRDKDGTVIEFPGLNDENSPDAAYCPSQWNGGKCGVEPGPAAPPEAREKNCFCGLPGWEADLHRIEVRSRGNVKEVCVDRRLDGSCVWEASGECSGANGCPSSGGHVWVGNNVHQCGGCAYCSSCGDNGSKCDPCHGAGPWPVFEMDSIALKRGPINESVDPVSGCGGGEGNAAHQVFKTIYTDEDGDFNNVQLLINKTSVIEPDPYIAEDPDGFFLGRFEIIQGMFGPVYQFCIRNNSDTNWICSGSLENSYAELLSASDYEFSPDGKTLTVTWNVEFKSAWEQEYANLWLYVIDESDLTDEFEDKGDFGIDNVVPDVPLNSFPADNDCTDERNPDLIVSTSDTGCGNWPIEYQFRLDYNENHNNWNEERTWGDNIWETSFDLPKGDYWWQAQARDSVGNISSWSDWWKFKIPCNEPPVAIITCDPPGARIECFAYTGGDVEEILILRNDSIDPDSTNPDGNNDIIKSEWNILDSFGIPKKEFDCCASGCYFSDPLCDYTVQGPDLGTGTFAARLNVIDKEGVPSVLPAIQAFTIKKDASADFRCYLDPANPSCDSCNSLQNLLIGQRIYLLDDCVQCPGACSEPSDGANLIDPPSYRKWEVVGGELSDSSSNNPFLRLRAETIEITLEIKDNAGRTASKTVIIGATLPLPDWREVPPR